MRELQNFLNNLISIFEGTNVTVETFPFINFDKSVLVVTRTERPNMEQGRNVMVVHQGHDDLDGVDILEH